MRSDTKHPKARLPKLAIASMSLGILGVLILALRILTYRPWWSEFVGRNIIGLTGIAGLILGMAALARISRLMVVMSSLVVLCSFLLFGFAGGKGGYQLLRTCSLYASLACLVGLFVSGLAVQLLSRSKEKFKGTAFTTSGIVLTTCLSVVWWAETCGSMSSAARMVCVHNLDRLGKSIAAYARDNGRYPEPHQWCDLLLKHRRVNVKRFICPGVTLRWRRQVIPWPVPKNARCYYAMNPHCAPNSPPDTVLLFETDGGWNRPGGPELLTTGNHGVAGCNVLFNDGHVGFVETGRFRELKWGAHDGEITNPGNSRMPANDEELRYWLESMVWYHRFSMEEIVAATGLTKEQIAAALKEFDIRPDNRPKHAEDAPLLVLPYPGGRHPRIGFLDGAIDPQRETKFSVFTPRDPDSYVVVDVPEAIWSNLGLTYLAHTHIDTIWTKQGIVLPKLEWNRRADGSLDIERELPNGIVFGAKAKPTQQAVLMELWLKNGTAERLTDLRVQICVMPKMARGFAQQTNENKVFTNPYVACRSAGGKRWVITAWEHCHRPWGNGPCPCFHSDPKFPDLEPGQIHTLHGWLSFYEGTDIEVEFKRIEETGWRRTAHGR
ncbi:MAG: hypothetical protein JSU70_15665 [Phycisphaerales bacterium]|nr:MAG: hypothetical protein JSU70_15665 [Phycisphaerales bacterium]